MQRARVGLFLVLALALGAPLTSEAQHSGGSFGGSSWGSGRSSSGSSSGSRSSGSGSWGSGSRSSGSSWGSGRSSGSYGGSYGGGSYGGGSYGSYGGGSGGGGGLGSLCCVVMFFVVVILIGMMLSRRKGTTNIAYTPYVPPGGGYGGAPGGDFTPETFSLGALAIAFDATVRAEVQAELDRIAQGLQMQNSPDALNRAAATMSQTLARFLDAAYMTHHAISEGLTMQAAQQQFQAAVDQERGRYIVETVRADAGGVRKVNAPASRARVEEGGGFVVVTLLVCRRDRFTGFRPATDRDALRNDLQILLAGPGALQAMEVVWVPSDPNDVMSSAEMAVKFPTLKPIAPDARVGRRACAYCKSVYAAELNRCPSCGAPAA